MLLECNEPIMTSVGNILSTHQGIYKWRSKALQTTNFLISASNNVLKFETQNLPSIYTTT